VVVEHADRDVDDDAFISLLRQLPEEGRLGLDCPLGWPVAFVAAVGRITGESRGLHARRRRSRRPSVAGY
jgi:hypothetical protein